MSVGLAIGVGQFAIEGPEVVEAAVRRRFGRFESRPGGLKIVVDSRRFDPEFEVLEGVQVDCDGEVATFEGKGRGRYHLASGEAHISDCTGFAPIEVMIRLALSTQPLLLLHGASLPGGVALCGDSGTGKSTAAEALGAACDELVVVAGEALHATPWWDGRPSSEPLRRIVCLRRGVGARRRLLGIEALRELLHHSVRYLASPALERRRLELAASVCARVPIDVVECPEGAGFLPFLREQL